MALGACAETITASVSSRVGGNAGWDRQSLVAVFGIEEREERLGRRLS